MHLLRLMCWNGLTILIVLATDNTMLVKTDTLRKILLSAVNSKANQSNQISVVTSGGSAVGSSTSSHDFRSGHGSHGSHVSILYEKASMMPSLQKIVRTMRESNEESSMYIQGTNICTGYIQGTNLLLSR